MKMKNMNLQDIFTKIISTFALKKKFDKAIGIYVDNEKILCVHLNLVRVENSKIEQWKVIDIAGTNTYINDEERINFEEDMQKLSAEKVAALCKFKDWQTNSIALCIDNDSVVVDMEDLSNVPKDKVSDSVHYQIAATGNFDVDTYLSSFMETELGIWMEGISKIDAYKWIQEFHKNGMEVLALTAMPNEVKSIADIDLSIIDSDFLERGGMKAVFAARSLAYQTNPNFLIEQTLDLNGWNFSRIRAAIIFVTFFIIAGIFAFDFWKYRQLEMELENVREQVIFLKSDQIKENFIEENSAELKNKNQLISTLSKNSFPWRGLLIHFGSVKIKGVWLREIYTLKNRFIEVKGEAVNFETMTSYVKALENDSIFSKVELKNSEAKSNSKLVQFTINLTL